MAELSFGIKMAEDDVQSDYCEEEEEEDDEATLDEEEANISSAEDDCDDELRQLQEDGELSLEELQRKYYGGGEEQQENANSDELLPLPSSSLSRDGEQPSFSAPCDEPSSPVHTDIALPYKIISVIAGTYGQISHSLTTLFQSENLEDDDTEDYVPPELHQKSVRIGDQFQVTVFPQPFQTVGNQSMDDLAEKLWCPSTDRCPNVLLNAYLKECGCQVPSTKSPADGPSELIQADDENALWILFKNNYEFEASKKIFLTMSLDEASSSPTFERANAPKRTFPAFPLKWSCEDCNQFEKGIDKHNKSFWKIRRDFLPSRTVGELVTFYYSWKKTERCDMWKAEKCRREQQVDAKTTDFMGQLTQSLFQRENNGMDGEKETQPTMTNPRKQQQQNGVGPMDKEKQTDEKQSDD